MQTGAVMHNYYIDIIDFYTCFGWLNCASSNVGTHLWFVWTELKYWAVIAMSVHSNRTILNLAIKV